MNAINAPESAGMNFSVSENQQVIITFMIP